MADINQYTFSGNLGADAEVRRVGDTNVVSFNVAVTESYKDKNDEWQDRTSWVKCSWWGKEKLARHLVKGSKVTVVGKPSAGSYESGGEIKVSLDVRVDNVSFVFIKDETAGF